VTLLARLAPGGLLRLRWLPPGGLLRLLGRLLTRLLGRLDRLTPARLPARLLGLPALLRPVRLLRRLLAAFRGRGVPGVALVTHDARLSSVVHPSPAPRRHSTT
jgi:hypothetical protein